MQTVLSLFLFVAAIAYVEYRFRALSNRMDEDQRDANSRFSTKEGLNATTERLTVKQAALSSVRTVPGDRRRRKLRNR